MAEQKPSRFLVVIGAVFTTATVAAAVLCLVYLLRPSIHAWYLYAELNTLQVGYSSFEDAQRVANNIGAHPVYGACDRLDCEWDIRMGNSELPEWWRGVGETFLVSFDVKDSIVVRKNTGYGIGIEPNRFSPSSVGVVEQEHWRQMNGPAQVQAGWQSSNLYKYYQFWVFMTPQASSADRLRYTSFNFNCFWKYRGCQDSRELLPVSNTFQTAPSPL